MGKGRNEVERLSAGYQGVGNPQSTPCLVSYSLHVQFCDGKNKTKNKKTEILCYQIYQNLSLMTPGKEIGRAWSKRLNLAPQEDTSTEGVSGNEETDSHADPFPFDAAVIVFGYRQLHGIFPNCTRRTPGTRPKLLLHE